MGMFDEVVVSCPVCKNTVVFQSKAGPCIFRAYNVHEVPIAIALSLEGHKEECSGCGAVMALVRYNPMDTVSMKAITE